MAKIINKLSSKVNSIWDPQSRVRFHFNSPSTWPENIDYDKNQNGLLDIFDAVGNLLPDIQDSNRLIPDTEIATIAFFTVPPLIVNQTGQLIANRTSKGNARDGHLHLYFVNKFAQRPCQSPPCKSTLGFATSIGGRYLFVQDDADPKGLGDHFSHVIAHELGHAIGLDHNSECNPQAHGPNELCDATNASQFFVSGLGVPNSDSDFLDTTSLMWYDARPGGSHVGLPHWIELNGVYPGNTTDPQ